MCTHCWTIQFKKKNYTGIQLGSEKPMWIIASVDINNSVSAYYQRDQEVSHDKIFQIICTLNALSWAFVWLKHRDVSSGSKAQLVLSYSDALLLNATVKLFE